MAIGWRNKILTPLIKVAFGTLSAVSPALAGRVGLWLFSTPLKTGRLTPAEKRLAARADAKLQSAEDISFNLKGEIIAAYRFGEKGREGSKRIILVHGWMSGARFMLAIADALASLGHEVIVFDLPAHGRSSGKSTNLVGCSWVLNTLLDHVGGADIIAAHSFGGAVTAYTLSRLRPKGLGADGKIILLASPNQLSSVTASFSRAMGLSKAAQKQYEERLCRGIGEGLDEMDGNKMYAQIGYPLHILHCANDAEVSIDQSRRYLELGDMAKLTELKGLGHRRILYHRDAITALVSQI
jgi:pimeloyl-ACP methyl ester carboxylesterase